MYEKRKTIFLIIFHIDFFTGMINHNSSHFLIQMGHLGYS